MIILVFAAKYYANLIHKKAKILQLGSSKKSRYDTGCFTELIYFEYVVCYSSVKVS